MFVLQLWLQQPKYHRKSPLFLYNEVYCNNAYKLEERWELHYCLTSFLWGFSHFWLHKEKVNMLLGLWKSKILPNSWSCSCWVCYNSWISRAIFAYSESSWSALLSASSLKRPCDLPGDSLSVIHVLLLWRFGRWIQPVPLSAESTSCVNKAWDPKVAYNEDEKQRNALSVRKWQKEKSFLSRCWSVR